MNEETNFTARFITIVIAIVACAFVLPRSCSTHEAIILGTECRELCAPSQVTELTRGTESECRCAWRAGQ